MTMVNLFEVFGMTPSFFPDLALLKKRYYSKSREYHPDFFTQSSEEEKSDALLQSSFINKAYKTILNPELRFKHLLRLEGIIQEDTKDEMQQSFLMEMMDFNEAIMELQFDFSKERFEELNSQLAKIKSDKLSDNQAIMESYPSVNDKQLQQLKALYFENKYLNRLEDNLRALDKT